MDGFVRPRDEMRSDVGDQLLVAASRPRPGQVLVRVFGDLDRLTVGRFEAALDHAITTVVAADRPGGGEETAEQAWVVCDLTGVGFLSVAAMAALLRVDATAAEHRVRWAVVVERRVRRLFEVAALDAAVPLSVACPISHAATTTPASAR